MWSGIIAADKNLKGLKGKCIPYFHDLKAVFHNRCSATGEAATSSTMAPRKRDEADQYDSEYNDEGNYTLRCI